jgi:hypothetical protein
MVYNRLSIDNLRPGCIKRCQVLVKVNTMSSDLIGGYCHSATVLRRVQTTRTEHVM